MNITVYFTDTELEEIARDEYLDFQPEEAGDFARAVYDLKPDLGWFGAGRKRKRIEDAWGELLSNPDEVQEVYSTLIPEMFWVGADKATAPARCFGTDDPAVSVWMSREKVYAYSFDEGKIRAIAEACGCECEYTGGPFFMAVEAER